MDKDSTEQAKGQEGAILTSYGELCIMNGPLDRIADALEVLAGRARVRSHQDYWTAQDWLAQAEATPPEKYHDPHEREEEIADNKRNIAFMEKEFPWLKES